MLPPKKSAHSAQPFGRLSRGHLYECLVFLYTGCPNKHGNLVTNSKSSFKIML